MDNAKESDAIKLQILRLRVSLADSEKSWSTSGLGKSYNPVAESIRRDIEEREALLAPEV